MARSQPLIRPGWPAFAAWAVCGALFTVAVLSVIGLLVMVPTAMLQVVLLGGSRRHPHDAVGLVAGLGAFSVFVGSLNLGYRPCPESGVLTLAPGATSASCGGLSPVPWLAAGAALIAVALVVYRIVRRNAAQHVPADG